MMKKFGKKLAAAGLIAGMTMSVLTGCSSNNANATVATMDGQEIKLGEVLVALRTGQASTESYLGSLFGEGNMWEQDLMGSGVAYGVSYKEQIMDSFKEMLILENHMADYEVELTEEEKTAISDAADQFLADNSKEVLKAMGADKETVSRVLTLYTIESKMISAIQADADTNVTDEEAAQKTIEYALFSTANQTDDEGKTVELTEEEKEAVKKQAQDTIDLVKGGKTFADAIKEVDENKSTLTNSYGTDSVLAEALTTAADQLEDGEICAEPVETENGWYVVQMVTTFDEEATEQKKEEIISDRKNDLYQEVLEGWEPESFEINSKVWDKVTFEDKFVVKTQETESETTEAVTQGAETTEAETTEEVTEEANTTEAASETENETESETVK